jgi:CRP-like cAMP-binding protein
MKQLINAKIFNGITKDNFHHMTGCLDIKEAKFHKGEFIFEANSEVNYFGLLIEGVVQVESTDYFGNRTIITKIDELETFAESFLFAEQKIIPFDVRAITDSKVVLINISSLNMCGSNCGFHNQLIRNILKISSTKNIYLNQRIRCLTKKTTREKLLYLILSRCTRTNCDSVELPFNREQLADYLAVNRSALSREIKKLIDERVIKVSKNRFTIIDGEKLEDLL